MEDIPEIDKVYEEAKLFMRKSGNMHQWINGYPSGKDASDDIEKGQCFVVCDKEGVVAVFALIFGDDPTYSYIENGQWQNSEPYGTIHRIGSNGKYHGIMKLCLDFALKKTNNVRIDTHKDNKPMQHVLNKLGFAECGIIYIADGSPRVAFQYTKH